MMSNQLPEREGIASSDGNPIILLGNEMKIGDTAPDFHVVDKDLNPVTLNDFSNKVVLISVTPSVDTSVCDLQAKRFNQMATELSDEVVILNISLDLPFALSRWCAATDSEQIKTLSDYQERDFGTKYGVLMKALKLLARSVWIIDKKGVIQYIQYTPEIPIEPDYDKAFDALKGVIS